MKVKELEWKGDIQDEEDVYAKGLFGEYHVCRSNHGYGDLWMAIFNEGYTDPPNLCDGVFGVCAQAERAKEYCQIHHEKRVKSALEFVEDICLTQQ